MTISNDRDTSACSVCGQYIYDNPLSQTEFRNYGYDPNIAFCIYCAMACADASDSRWYTRGEPFVDDPYEWPDDITLGAAELFLAYHTAAFWSRVWSDRAVNRSASSVIRARLREASEEATARQLMLVNRALDAHEFIKAMKLLLPIGSTDPTVNQVDDVRLMAFHPSNIAGVSEAWSRLLGILFSALPAELVAQSVARDNACRTSGF